MIRLEDNKNTDLLNTCNFNGPVNFTDTLRISSTVNLNNINIANGLSVSGASTLNTLNVLGSSTWAEIYGVKYIGSIKALTTALMVLSTAFGTAFFGILIDRGFSIEKIAVISSIYISISLIMLFIIRSKLNPVKV